MTNRTPRIDEFRDITGLAEIVGLGRVRQPNGGAQEVECQVLLARHMGLPSFDQDRDTMFRWVGCGQLDLLTPGSLWRQGTYWGADRTLTEVGDFRYDRDENLGLGDRYQPLGGKPFPTSGIHDAPCFLLEEPREPGPASKRRAILLPKMELARCIFGVGNDILLELFDGLQGSPVAPDRSTIDRLRSFDNEDGSVVITSSRDLSDDKALVIAATLFDKRVQGLHRRVYQQLSVDRHFKDGDPIYVNMPWPWSEPVSMRVSGRWVRRLTGPQRFIVSRIDEISIPLSFSRIEIRHPGSSRAMDLDQPRASGRMRLANAAQPALATGRASSPSRHPVTVPTGTSGTLDASGITITRVEHSRGSRGAEDIIGERGRDEALIGTGGRQQGSDPEIGSAITQRGEMLVGDLPARSIEDALRKTWSALDTACSVKGWKMRAIPRQNPVSANTPFGGLDFTREPLVVAIHSGGDRVLVVDRGSPSGSEVSLGILIPSDGRTTDRELAASARRTCTSVDGRWRSPRCRSDDFRIVSVNRTQKMWDDADAFGDAMIRRLDPLLEKDRR